ncbi:MAG: UTP--glucose-1-phosphate uridylyltransferase [Clostridiales bacterium]|jgi:UTP--glucose-1-phosphate uridylyltransferase|nr:UTP--glucose-1-phosphate uridylyltransferase [Clostridiales bacterium]
MDKITKGVVPCAGMGTRFLPITKSLPKELLPVIDTPVLQYIIDEFVNSGITDILLIINAAKLAIKHYFEPNNAIIDKLLKAGKHNEASMLQELHKRANIVFEYQEQPKGSGDAVLHARNFVGEDVFALAWGDDLIVSQIPAVAQLIQAYNSLGTSILGVQEILTDDIVKYGIPRIKSQQGDSYLCSEIVEKPSLDKVPSRLAALGRYILTPDIFDEITSTRQNNSGELHLTVALNSLSSKGQLWATKFEGTRFDMGDKLGALKATVHFGIERFGDAFRDYLQQI